ncbi:MAG: hypothetical protein JWP27_1835 [Flaviaesturariibacter sp.]|nr:hypothetical protein [Flaviaesturariibacter sp.]
MENTNTELSNRTGAAFSWLEFLGLVLVVLSRTAFKQQEWLFYVGAVLILSSYGYKLVRDWRAGKQKAVRTRLLILVVAIAAGALVGYFKMRAG